MKRHGWATLAVALAITGQVRAQTAVEPSPASAAAPAPGPAPSASAAPGPAAPAPAPAPTAPMPGGAVAAASRPGKRYTTWDLNLDGAYGRLFTDPSRPAGFGRLRVGALWVRDPTFFSLGATYELSNFSSATFGLQGEWMNLEVGVWAQAGPLLDVDNGVRLGVMGAVGWSVIGVEVQGRDMPDAGFVPAVFGKLRIPIGIVAFGLRGR